LLQSRSMHFKQLLLWVLILYLSSDEFWCVDLVRAWCRYGETCMKFTQMRAIWLLLWWVTRAILDVWVNCLQVEFEEHCQTELRELGDKLLTQQTKLAYLEGCLFYGVVPLVHFWAGWDCTLGDDCLSVARHSELRMWIEKTCFWNKKGWLWSWVFIRAITYILW